MKKILALIIFFLSSFQLVSFWLANADRFTRAFDYEYFSELYSNSQYVLGPKSEGGIGDDGLYAFAGYYYFFQKGDVSAVNFEHPPLGKYLIGLSVFLFNNELTINIIYFLVFLVFTYKISRVYLDKYLSLLPLVVLMVDPLFLDHTIRSQLDLPFSLFFLMGIYFFIISEKNPKLIFVSQFFWGCAFATRFFPFLLILELYMFLLIFLQKKANLKLFVLSFLMVPAVYILTHLSFFVYHPSIIEFLRHKKWMISWFTGTPVKVGNILRNYLTGTLFDSTDMLIKNKEWSILQPAALLFALIPLKLNVLFGFSVLYFVYTVFLTGGQAKFLMPVFPIMTILSVQNLKLLYSIIGKWKHPK